MAVRRSVSRLTEKRGHFDALIHQSHANGARHHDGMGTIPMYANRVRVKRNGAFLQGRHEAGLKEFQQPIASRVMAFNQRRQGVSEAQGVLYSDRPGPQKSR